MIKDRRKTTSARKQRRILDQDRMRKLGSGPTRRTSCWDCDANYALFNKEDELVLFCDNLRPIGLEKSVIANRFVPEWCQRTGIG